MTQHEQERRASGRFDTDLRVTFLLVREGACNLEVRVSNLSAGGCFVESDAVVREGDRVKLCFSTPGHGSVTAWGHVVHAIPPKGFGVHFTAVSHGGGPDTLAAALEEAAFYS